MATERINDPRAFRDFLDAALSTGEATLTLDEALGFWESENQTSQEHEETLEAIRRGLADVEAGRVRPARDPIADLRRRHNLPDLS
jgi:hypothetical protein